MEKQMEFKYIACPRHFALWYQANMTGGKWIYFKQTEFEKRLTGPVKEATYEFFTTACHKCNKKTFWKYIRKALNF